MTVITYVRGTKRESLSCKLEDMSRVLRDLGEVVILSATPVRWAQ